MWLPWILAVGMLAVYLLTLKHGVAPGNLGEVVELSGWNWRPNVFGPVTILVTYPLRQLPANMIAPAANLLSALCAALTLALLARSVVLLPRRSRLSHHDNHSAWLPPILAVLACGLQSTFWENAIEARGEMLDLLLFAYLVRCVMEFRLNPNPSWMTRFAFVFGLSLANNWAMLGFLPLFVGVLFWAGFKEGFRLFLRMALFGLAGLSLLLLLPLIGSFSHARHIGFWAGLRLVLGTYKYMLVWFPKGPFLLLSLISVLPVAFMGIRWASFFRSSDPGAQILVAKGVFNLIHAAFLIVSICVALDYPLSPRHQGLGFAFLPLYYLGALSVGYFSGHFLLLFGPELSEALRRGPVSNFVGSIVIAVIWFLLVAIPGLLVCRNLPQVLASNRSPWQGYFSLVEKSLPSQGAIILSNDPFRLYAFQAALAREGRQLRHLPVDTTALGDAAYLKFLDQNYPQFNLANTVSNRFSGHTALSDQIQLIETLSRSHGLYYLHPSFGYYFEVFYPQAHGLVYQLKPYGTNIVGVPPPSREQLAENELFWHAAAAEQFPPVLHALQQMESQAKRNPIDRFLAHVHLDREPDQGVRIVGAWYSRALDYWGVELQGCGQYPEAAKYFSQAQELNPDNMAARVNQGFNQNLQAGQKPLIQPGQPFEDKSGRRREWTQALQEDGPFAEPNFCHQAGVAFAKHGLYRQAIQQFNQVQALAPDLTDARFWLARLFIHTENYSNALATVNHLLQTSPKDDNVLFLKAVSLLQSKSYNEAIEPFTHLLTLNSNNYAAQLNRAIAYLQLGQLDAARRDYEKVAKAIPGSYQASFGLAEIAFRQKDTSAAIRNYQRYLTSAPQDTEEAEMVLSRLKDLKVGQP